MLISHCNQNNNVILKSFCNALLIFKCKLLHCEAERWKSKAEIRLRFYYTYKRHYACLVLCHPFSVPAALANVNLVQTRFHLAHSNSSNANAEIMANGFSHSEVAEKF